ncbi:MAG: carboxypeptidase M32 [Planctomycetes bacterium]|nr:carboxypeptidase M32 [Planctomycetota bacterium]
MLHDHPVTAYEELVDRSRGRAMLVSCLELLAWDELTCMPRGGVGNRGRQTAYLVGLLHDASSDPRFGDLLELVEGSDLMEDPESASAVNARVWRRQHDRAVRVPRGLLEELARVTTIAQQQWAESRQDGDFRSFLPHLARVVRLKRDEAACFAGTMDAYDALLDDFEPGCTRARLARLFRAIQEPLQDLLGRIAEKGPMVHSVVLRRDYPIDRQRILGESIAADIGFDFECGRLDATTHPFFSCVGPGDCRITTRYDAHDFGESFFAILHEIGHGLYEQGLAPDAYGTPMGESSSLGVHESQSRIWENLVGRSRSFWRHCFPRVRDLFHTALHDIDEEDFHRVCNEVRPSWNRVRADEVSYDLHILVRFELEQSMIAGELDPSDVPGAWNERYARVLGVTPRDDREGCLQDGHWAAGQFGYFPTYTLGNLFAAQLMAGARRDLPDLDDRFAEGEFRGLREWLRERIYRHGQRYSADELVRRATGSPADPATMMERLRRKYEELYEI